MNASRLAGAAIAAALVVSGCAFIPQTNTRLEEVRVLHHAALANPELRRLAPVELTRAAETFHLADTAWNTLDDSAVVDHLAYVARQRIAIAQETARRVSAERVTSVSTDPRR
jgi:hypothetical protein